jgi:hypothetical protein
VPGYQIPGRCYNFRIGSGFFPADPDESERRSSPRKIPGKVQYDITGYIVLHHCGTARPLYHFGNVGEILAHIVISDPIFLRYCHDKPTSYCIIYHTLLGFNKWENDQNVQFKLRVSGSYTPADFD